MKSVLMPCAALFVASFAFAETVPARIAMSPKAGVDRTAEFLSALEQVRRAGGGTIELEPGDYRLASPVKSDIWVSNHDNPRPRRLFLPVMGVTNLTMTCATGEARLVAEGEGICLALVDTKDVRITGVACDYLRPFYSIWRLKAGKLVADGDEFPYVIKDGNIYSTGPGWTERQTLCQIFDKDTGIYLGGHGWNGSAEKVFGGYPDGSLAMTRSGYRPSPCVFLYRCVNTSFFKCGAYASSGMGLIAQRSEDVLLDGWHTRGKRPLALQADATHFSNCRGRIVLKNGVFERTVDDAINVHSTALKILEKTSPDTIVCKYCHSQSVGFEVFLPGETLRFIRGRTLEPGSEVKVAAVKMLAHDRVEIRLASPVPAPYGKDDAVENADWQPEVEFVKNIVRNLNPRGALFTTPGKIVCAENLFENIGRHAIYFAGDAWFWYESGACRDVVIRDNVIRNCGYDTGRGVIQIEPVVFDLPAQKARYHRNILIENNVFENFKLPIVWARSAENVVLRNNKIINGNEKIVIDRNSADVRIERPDARTYRGIRPGDANGRDGLLNPERGFRFEVGVGVIGTDRVPWDRCPNWPFERYRKDGITLTQAYCYLTQYHDGDIAPEKIAALEADFARARAAGVKFILRFAYETDMERKQPGPTAERILAHIRQLTPVVRRNIDVVYVLQTGWVGAWGEFHSSYHQIEKDPKAVAAIMKATLEMLPPGHFTMMRCMRYKTNVLKTLGDPRELSAATAWSDAPHARIGYFNDGFLANVSDGGTYIDPPFAAPGNVEYDKVAREGLWMPVEGELFWTPAGEYARSNATNAIETLNRQHFTTLSVVHGNSELESKTPWTIDGWKKATITPALLKGKGVAFDPDYFAGVDARTGYEFIRDHLGYRLAAKRFECGEIQPGKPLALSLELFNYGFGTPIKERKAVFVVLDAEGKAVELETGFSCRALLAGTGAKVEWKGTLDASLGKGPYRIGLWLPDAASSLRRRPEYAIRLASALPVEDIDGRRLNILTATDPSK